MLLSAEQSLGFLEGNVKIGGIHYLTEPVLVLSSHLFSLTLTLRDGKTR